MANFSYPPRLDSETLAAFETRATEIFKAIEILARNEGVHLSHIFASALTLSVKKVPYRDMSLSYQIVMDARGGLGDVTPKNSELCRKVFADWHELAADYAAAYAVARDKARIATQEAKAEREQARKIAAAAKRQQELAQKKLEQAEWGTRIKKKGQMRADAAVMETFDMRARNIYETLTDLLTKASPQVSKYDIFSLSEINTKRVRYKTAGLRNGESFADALTKIRGAFGNHPPADLEKALDDWRTLRDDYQNPIRTKSR